MNNATHTTRTDAMTDTTRPRAVFMMGGPGSGKSWIRRNDDNLVNMPVVDCDQFKAAHPDYDPQNPSILHAWSAEQCTKEFYRRLSGNDSFVYDGTGTNVEKMVAWMMQAATAGFTVELVYVRCAMQTALKRNRNRERIVPEHIVREKHAVVEQSWEICQGYADIARTIDNN